MRKCIHMHLVKQFATPTLGQLPKEAETPPRCPVVSLKCIALSVFLGNSPATWLVGCHAFRAGNA